MKKSHLPQIGHLVRSKHPGRWGRAVTHNAGDAGSVSEVASSDLATVQADDDPTGFTH